MAENTRLTFALELSKIHDEFMINFLRDLSGASTTINREQVFKEYVDLVAELLADGDVRPTVSLLELKPDGGFSVLGYYTPGIGALKMQTNFYWRAQMGKKEARGVAGAVFLQFYSPEREKQKRETVREELREDFFFWNDLSDPTQQLYSGWVPLTERDKPTGSILCLRIPHYDSKADPADIYKTFWAVLCISCKQPGFFDRQLGAQLEIFLAPKLYKIKLLYELMQSQ